MIKPRTKPTRVLVLQWGNSGGGPRFAFSVADALRLQPGVDTLVSYNARSEIAGRFAEAFADRGLSVVTYLNSREALFGVVRFARLVVGLRRFIREHDIEVVYSAMFSLWQSLAVGFALPARVVFVASVHDAVDHPGEEHWAKRLCYWLERRRADVLVSYSESVADQFRARYPHLASRLVATVHGADVPAKGAEARARPECRALKIGYFGRILPYKGIDLFVGALRLLADEGMDVVGEVWGEGKIQPDLVAMSAGVCDWRLGWVSEDEVLSVVSSFDVLVLPYRESSQSGVVTLAFSSGVPVVCTPVGGLSEQVGASRAGVVASAVSERAIADAIAHLVSAPAVYEEASKSGLEAVREMFSWGRTAADLENTFSWATGRERSR